MCEFKEHNNQASGSVFLNELSSGSGVNMDGERGKRRYFVAVECMVDESSM